MVFSSVSTYLKFVVPPTFSPKVTTLRIICSITAPRMYSTRLPIIRQQLADNTEAEISEDALFHYTRHRWLTHDEPEILANRQLKFNVAALLEIAVAAVGGGATQCMKVLKCLEGSYNKSLLLTMDNGVEVMAKLPNPNAGPAFFTTASQVATQRFAREVLNMPCPRVYTYSAKPDSAVGAEYIIEEKAAGKPLSSVWYTWSEEAQIRFVSQLAELETKLSSLQFRCHGCLYHKSDLVQHRVSIRDLQAPLLHPTSPKCSHPSLRDYAIGPIATAALWADERAVMNNLDRGPCELVSLIIDLLLTELGISPLDYMTAIGLNERSWAQSHAAPRIDPYSLSDEPRSPSSYISLLDQYLQLTRHVAPAPMPATLSHPDLHLDNIFVDPGTKEIKCIIDWQSASVSEPYFQHRLPPFLTPIALTTEIEVCDEAEPESEASPEIEDFLTRLPNLSSHYDTCIKQSSLQQWAAKHDENRHFLTKVVSSVTGSWTRDSGFSLRHNLITVAMDWGKTISTDIPCPLHFTQAELADHKRELKIVAELAPVLEQLEQAGIIPNAGKVLVDDFGRALDASRSVKDWFVGKGSSKDEQDLNAKIWPYRT